MILCALLPCRVTVLGARRRGGQGDRLEPAGVHTGGGQDTGRTNAASQADLCKNLDFSKDGGISRLSSPIGKPIKFMVLILRR